MTTAAPAPITTPRSKPCGHAGDEPGCPGCALYAVDEEFRAAWGGPPLPPPPEDELHVVVRAWGIGDAVLGLAACHGLKLQRPRARLTYVCHTEQQRAWCALFGGYDRLTTDRPGRARVLYPHTSEAEMCAGAPRWRHYADNVGARAAVLPPARPIPPDAVEWALPHRGAVLLCPWTASDAGRRWPLDRWLALERLLRARGRRCLVLDDDAGRNAPFPCGKVIGESPRRVAALLLGASCLVANDSGMAHVAGALGAPALVLSWRRPWWDVFGLYPAVTGLQRQPGELCPDEVLPHVLARPCPAGALPEPPFRESDVHPHVAAERADLFRAWDGGSVEAETAELLTALVRCYKPGVVLETGTYLGVAARVLGLACRKNGLGRVVTLERDPARAAAARAALADVPEVEVVTGDALAWLRAYAGPPFGLAVLDSDTSVRTEEVRLLRERGLLGGPAFVHDTSRLRHLTAPDAPWYPAALDALGLPGIECPYARGWRVLAPPALPTPAAGG